MIDMVQIMEVEASCMKLIFSCCINRIYFILICINLSSFSNSFYTYKYIADYFPINVVKTVDLPANRNYLLAFVPHGVLGYDYIDVNY